MPNDPEEKPTPESIASYVKSNSARAKSAQQMHHESVVTREADYKGHHIVVRTTYQVEVDGKPLMGHMGVSNDGDVHYHPVPNLQFASALDMVKKIIDVFPSEFEPGATTAEMPGMAHGSMPGMSGMAMKKKPAAKAAKKAAKPAKKGKV